MAQCKLSASNRQLIAYTGDRGDWLWRVINIRSHCDHRDFDPFRHLSFAAKLLSKVVSVSDGSLIEKLYKINLEIIDPEKSNSAFVDRKTLSKVSLLFTENPHMCYKIAVVLPAESLIRNYALKVSL